MLHEKATFSLTNGRGCIGVAVLALTFCWCLLLSTCVSRVEVTRVKSPDGKLVASVFEINGGATTDFAYEVDVAHNWPRRWNSSVAGLYGATRSECAYGVNVRWPDNNTLLITYKDAKSTDIDPTVHMFGRTVRIVTKRGIDDPAALCGGMDYSQGGAVYVR